MNTQQNEVKDLAGCKLLEAVPPSDPQSQMFGTVYVLLGIGTALMQFAWMMEHRLIGGISWVGLALVTSIFGGIIWPFIWLMVLACWIYGVPLDRM